LALSRYCLDTSAYSRLKRGDQLVARRLEQADWVGLPATVIGELHAGFAMSSRRERNIAELDDFLAQPMVEELVTNREAASFYGEIIADLRARGTPLPTNDIWIAAVCARAGATLLTSDTHFRAIPRIGTIVLDSV
jgi:tRNA(fMet)-specific endonuclease VapC